MRLTEWRAPGKEALAEPVLEAPRPVPEALGADGDPAADGRPEPEA